MALQTNPSSQASSPLQQTLPQDGTSAEAPYQTAPVSRRSVGRPGGSFAAFHYLSFRYLWAGNLFSSSAMFIQQITINWLVYDLTSSPLMLGLVSGTRVLPMALTAPFSGVLADRVDRRKLILRTQVFLTLSALLFASDVALGHVTIWHVFIFTFLVGVGNSVNNTARQSILPQIVPRQNLVSAVAWSSVSQNATRTIGPAIGGILISVMGMAVNFFIQAGCYIGVFFAVLPIRARRDDGAESEHRREPFFRSMAEGFRYMLSDKPVFSLILLGVVPMFFIFPAQTLVPVFARDIFHKGATGYGIFLMAMGVGSLVGTLALATTAEVKSKSLVLYLLLTLAIGASVAFAWARSLPLALAVLGAQGAAQMTYFSLNNATLQMRVPDSVLGRVMSVYNLNLALIPLGGLIAGLLAETLGAPLALTIMGGTGLLFVVVAIIALPAVRKL